MHTHPLHHQMFQNWGLVPIFRPFVCPPWPAWHGKTRSPTEGLPTKSCWPVIQLLTSQEPWAFFSSQASPLSCGLQTSLYRVPDSKSMFNKGGDQINIADFCFPYVLSLFKPIISYAHLSIICLVCCGYTGSDKALFLADKEWNLHAWVAPFCGGGHFLS